jgi:hypothetical protein
MLMPSALIKVSLCVAVAIAVAGCTSSGSGIHATTSAKPTPTASTKATSPAATQPPSVPDTTGAAPGAGESTVPPLVQNPLPDSVPNDPDVRKNVAQTKCEAVDGGWGAEGTATNPGTAPVTYSITVYFTTPTATVLDYATTTVSVAPGATEKWSASKQFAAVADMLCPMPGISLA